MKSICFLALAMSMAFSHNALAAGDYLVDSISYNGSGCGPGFASWRQQGDSLQVEAQSYSVSLDSDQSRLERKNCQLSIDILKPEGWTFRVSKIKASGWARVSGSVEASLRLAHYFQASAVTQENSKIFNSWYRGGYEAKVEKGEWAPCGSDRALNVNTSLMLRRNSDSWASAYIKLNPKLDIQLDWKRCD